MSYHVACKTTSSRIQSREESMKTNLPISARSAILVLAAASLLVAAPPTRAQELRDGQAVLRAMHDRYQNNWYRTVTFSQVSTTRNPDGTSKSEIWREALMLPGKLRIDIGPWTDGNGYLFADGTLTSFRGGKIAETRPFVHMLLVLGFDVYRQPPEKTIAIVREKGFDLAAIHEDTWQGQPVYVIGAAKGDLTSRQFWIEKNRLLFVRLIQPDERDKSKLADSRFADYRRLSVGWIAARVEFFIDGKNTFSESYSDIRANPRLDPAILDPKQFNSRHWEK
jgi:hypothetical protein